MTGDYIMNDYSEVFELIEKGEWDLTDFSVWLNDYKDQVFGEGYEEGYWQCNEEISMGSI